MASTPPPVPLTSYSRRDATSFGVGVFVGLFVGLTGLVAYNIGYKNRWKDNMIAACDPLLQRLDDYLMGSKSPEWNEAFRKEMHQHGSASGLVNDIDALAKERDALKKKSLSSCASLEKQVETLQQQCRTSHDAEMERDRLHEQLEACRSITLPIPGNYTDAGIVSRPRKAASTAPHSLDECHDLHQRYDTLNGLLSSLMTSCGDLSRSYEELQKDCQRKEAQYRSTREDLDRINVEYAQCRENLRSSRERERPCQEELSRVKTEYVTLTRTVRDMSCGRVEDAINADSPEALRIAVARFLKGSKEIIYPPHDEDKRSVGEKLLRRMCRGQERPRAFMVRFEALLERSYPREKLHPVDKNLHDGKVPVVEFYEPHRGR